jgi:Tfp pilus assembly protein PilF
MLQVSGSTCFFRVAHRETRVFRVAYRETSSKPHRQSGLLRMLSCIFCLCVLAGCASRSASVVRESDPLYQHEHFGARPAHINTDAVFQINDAMRQYVRVTLADQLAQGRIRALYEALFHSAQLKLDYDTVRTGTASETFATRQGNCLSLVIMTAVLAEELNIPTTFLHVLIDEHWLQRGDLNFASTHVNIVLGKIDRQEIATNRSKALIVDFAPVAAFKVSDVRRLSKARVLAMFANNRAAESVIDGRLSEAYWWSRVALENDPKYLVALNTMAVVFRRSGQPELAELALMRVRDMEPNNVHALVNLQGALKDQGRTQDVLRLENERKRLRPVALYADFRAALLALEAKDFARARDLLLLEARRHGSNADVRFQLARSFLGLGQYTRALAELERAVKLSTTVSERAIYTSKLDALKRR